jgi:hypothetical protein
LWTNKTNQLDFCKPVSPGTAENPQRATSSEKRCHRSTYKNRSLAKTIFAHTPSNKLKLAHNSNRLPNNDLQPRKQFWTFCGFAGAVQQFIIPPPTNIRNDAHAQTLSQ